MGRDKLLLALPSGDVLLEFPAAALRATCTDLLAVGARPEHHVHLAGFRTVADALPDCGPLGGVLAALESAPTPWVLVLAADLPCVDAGLLSALQTAAEVDPDRALVTDGPGGPEPLVAAWPRALAPLLRRRLLAGERKAENALPPSRRRRWPYGEALRNARLDDPFRNVNAPGDWADFQSAFGSSTNRA